MLNRCAHAQACIIALLVAVIIGAASAQDLPPPKDRVLDDTRALTEAERATVIADLAKFHSDFDYDIWIAASTFLSTDRNVRQHARDLRQAWSRDQPAVMLAYDRASGNHAVSIAPALWERYSAARLILLMQHCHTLMTDQQRPLNERLTQTTAALIRMLRLLEKHHKQLRAPLPVSQRRLATRFVPLLIIGAAITALAGVWMQRRDVLTNWQMLFPSVQVGIRLGAPFGGGVTAEWQPLSPLQPTAQSAPHSSPIAPAPSNAR